MNKTKQAIFNSAIKVFSGCGYDGATMDDIAVNAGVAKGTLYYHFKSKEDIFKFIITDGMNVIIKQIEEATEAEEDSLIKLKILCRVQLSLVYENRDFFKVIMSQLWGREIRHLQIREVIQVYINIIENHLKEAMEQGVVKKSNISFMSYTFLGTLCSAAVYELISKDDTDVENVIDNLMQYILTGIQV
ncbi:TetR/AcrR family transcriptional regulator [Clostridium estertheticum]|uniref:TetR/AcrR family transcriptional regulator n=1 Tax=Clostridium estertheticum TaxID=238834 RepID=UPI0013E9576F|nr:TetR/AcrR family transcriptional regulator [Clostridium estertheticum]MBZ9689609.1 TetR/AcrR family transcriptional regulator [Clostridium estertheticum]